MAKAPALPPVVMIHGAFCGGWVFDGLRTSFEAKGYKVHTPTLRYHDCGNNPPALLGTTSVLDYAADLEKDISTLKSAPILVGHSMGGLLAQMLAARNGVHALVLLAPSAPWGMLPSTMFEYASAGAMFFAGDFWSKPIQPSYDIAASNALDMLPPEDRSRIFARFVPESGLATFEIMHWALDARRATAVDANKVTCPVLCLSGRYDKVNPPATVRRIAQRYRNRAVYEDLDDHSHWMLGEPGWEKIAERAQDWLEEISQTVPG
ncbi:MAG TPA: alpha/beta hydrolase [Rhizomicrobium sp.]|nr:alpha/beta hydrolase [Rhizomicrobium sp.]